MSSYLHNNLFVLFKKAPALPFIRDAEAFHNLFPSVVQRFCNILPHCRHCRPNCVRITTLSKRSVLLLSADGDDTLKEFTMAPSLSS